VSLVAFNERATNAIALDSLAKRRPARGRGCAAQANRSTCVLDVLLESWCVVRSMTVEPLVRQVPYRHHRLWRYLLRHEHRQQSLRFELPSMWDRPSMQ
jgi:hypothetical protein